MTYVIGIIGLYSIAEMFLKDMGSKLIQKKNKRGQRLYDDKYHYKASAMKKRKK